MDIVQFVDSIGQIYNPISDTFTRTVANGWGAADTGEVWTPNAAAQFSTNGTVGQISVEAVGARRMVTLGVSLTDVDMIYSVSIPVTAAGAAITSSALLRYVSASTHYYAGVQFETAGTITARIVRRVADVDATLASVATGLTYTPGTLYRVRTQIVGSTLRMRVWDASGSEPTVWHASAPAITAAGAVGIRALLTTGNTNTLPVILSYDNLSVSPVTQIRLDINDYITWGTTYDSDFSPPALKTAWASTLMADGELQTASAYENRRLKLALELKKTTPDGIATELQKLSKELNRDGNFLKWQPAGMTNPVFFRTIRSSETTVQDYPGDGTFRTVDVVVQAEPFAYGLKETLPTTTVYNDPAEGTTLNANPYFETDVSNWTPVGGTFVRSTAQFHQGVASGLLTPDGVTASVSALAEKDPVTVGLSYRASAWLYCAVARSINVQILWYDSLDALLSTSSTSVSVTANTWTLLDGTFTAPALAATGALRVSMGSTPLASHLLYVDEARLRQSGGVGGMCFDVTGIKGDVESPLYLTADTAGVVSGITTQRRKTALAVRRRGTPSLAPFALQCEAMDPAPASDTTVSSAAAGASGGSHMRTTFATTQGMFPRFGPATLTPAQPSVDARGTYRVYLRVRQTVATDVIAVQMFWGTTIENDKVTLPTSSSTSWKYVDLGLVQNPVGYVDTEDGVSGVETLSGGIGLVVYAQRVSGTGSLDSDVLLLVPADDRLLLLTWPGTAGPSTGATSFVVDSNRGEIYGLGASGERFPTNPVEPEGGFPMISPGVTNRVYLARDVGWETAGIGETGPGDDITGTVTVGAYYWPRYLTVRST